jgi:putative tryptophan/tyrosine transport system substrate-binding protein
MTRRQWLATLVIGVLVTPFPAFSQSKERVWRVGFLLSRSRPEVPESDYHIGLPRGLKELGYVEGKNLVIERRFADGKYERFPDLLAELLRIPVDIIVTDGTPTTLAAQKATRTIPIVFGSAGDPVGNGLVASLAQPGGNTTGIALLSNDTSTKQLEMLRGMVPGLSRVAVLSNPGNQYSSVGLKSLRAAGEAMKVQILSMDVRTPQDIEEAFPSMKRERAGAALYVPDSFLGEQRGLMARLAMKHQIPFMGPGRQNPEAGGLMSYGQNMEDNYRRAATYVDKILKGARPSDLPVQQPTQLELVINRKTAKALGLTIPPELLLLADKVIE